MQEDSNSNETSLSSYRLNKAALKVNSGILVCPLEVSVYRREHDVHISTNTETSSFQNLHSILIRSLTAYKK